MTDGATGRRALEDHLGVPAGADLTIAEEPTGLDGWSFYQARQPGDRREPGNWAVRDGHVITDAREGLDLLGHDLAELAKLPSADDVAIAVVSISRPRGEALTTQRLDDEPFWRRWRSRPRVSMRGDQLTVRCLVAHSGRESSDEQVVEMLTVTTRRA